MRYEILPVISLISLAAFDVSVRGAAVEPRTDTASSSAEHRLSRRYKCAAGYFSCGAGCCPLMVKTIAEVMCTKDFRCCEYDVIADNYDKCTGPVAPNGDESGSDSHSGSDGGSSSSSDNNHGGSSGNGGSGANSLGVKSFELFPLVYCVAFAVLMI